MSRFTSTPLMIAAVWLLIGTAAVGIQHWGAPQAEARRAFEQELSRYSALRTRLEEPLPAFDDPRRDGWTRLLMRRYLASAIRTARRDAEPGCIFGPAALFIRETIAGAVYDLDIEGLIEGGVDEEEFALDLALNEPIPSSAMSPLPAPLAERLPALPQAIEYRIAAGALILWDTRAEILVDVLPDAFVAP